MIGFCAQVDKHLPASMRRKLLQELKAKFCVFKVLPLAGALAPGQRCNVRVRFLPMEEVRWAGVSPRRSGRAVGNETPAWGAGHEVCLHMELSTSPIPTVPQLPPQHTLSRGALKSRWGACTESIRALWRGSLLMRGGKSACCPASSPSRWAYLQAAAPLRRAADTLSGDNPGRANPG